MDQVFILTDRKSLDKNIKDDIENFKHLKDVVRIPAKTATDSGANRATIPDETGHPSGQTCRAPERSDVGSDISLA